MGRYPWAVRAGGPLLGGGGGAQPDFVSTWKTDNAGTSNDDQITLPLIASGTYNFDVDWGDGSAVDTITAFNDAAVTHTFTGGAGTFTVTITGTTIDGWQFNNGGDALKLTEISSWGILKPGTVTTGQFYGCSNLSVTATNTLDTSTVTNMISMFRDCSSLLSLGQSGFDTSSVVAMISMFRGCSSLTSVNLSSFDTSNVTDMQSMFLDCTSLTTINVSGFDTSIVANMANMFQNCSSVISLDVSGFVTSAVTSMSGMFRNCGTLTTLDVSGFDTSLVTNMISMFRDASGITSLAMDQAGWDVGLVTDMTSFCQSLTLGTANYDAILAAWAALPSLQSAVTCSFGNSEYTIATAQADRDVLTDPPNSWILTDGGGV